METIQHKRFWHYWDRADVAWVTIAATWTAVALVACLYASIR